MKKIRPIGMKKNYPTTDIKNLKKLVNRLVTQTNNQIEEIRLIKTKLRVTGHFGTRR